MDYRLGNSLKIKEVGQTTKLTCPKCMNEVKLSVFSNFNARLTADFPLVKAENIYFLVCPSCSRIFGADKKNFSLFKKGDNLTLDASELKELETFVV